MIVQVLALIEDLYAEPSFCPETVRDTLRISERQIARLLKHHTGLTFTAYVRRLRIEKAKSLLADSKANVKAVSAMVGYGEVTWFTRYFRQATGLTPRQFRNQQTSTNVLEDVRFRIVPTSESAWK